MRVLSQEWQVICDNAPDRPYPGSAETGHERSLPVYMAPFSRRHHPGVVRWYVRYPLSSHDVEELLPERGVWVDHTPCFAGFSARNQSRIGNAGRLGGRPTTRTAWMRPASRSNGTGTTSTGPSMPRVPCGTSC